MGCGAHRRRDQDPTRGRVILARLGPHLAQYRQERPWSGELPEHALSVATVQHFSGEMPQAGEVLVKRVDPARRVKGEDAIWERLQHLQRDGIGSGHVRKLALNQWSAWQRRGCNTDRRYCQEGCQKLTLQLASARWAQFAGRFLKR